MIPGEIIPADGDILLNEGRPTVTLEVANTGDRPVQVGSHYHFFETNEALQFDRGQARGMRLDIPARAAGGVEPGQARGMRLDIPAGTAVRFEPGQTRDVTLIPYAGSRTVYGFNAKVSGKLEK